MATEALSDVEVAAPAVVAPAPVLVAPVAPKSGAAHALPFLYAGMVVAQTMDLVSTRKALSMPGSYETNPIFGSVSSSLAGSIALKAGVTGGIIFMTERVRKTNPVMAVVTMVALNSAYAMIAAHNYALASQLGGR